MPSWTPDQMLSNPAGRRTLGFVKPDKSGKTRPSQVPANQQTLPANTGNADISGQETPQPSAIAPRLDSARSDGEMRSNPASELRFTVHVAPMGAPRMVRSDKWKGLPGSKVKRRPCVQRYFDFRDKMRQAVGNVPVPDGLFIVAHIAMPESWSKKKKSTMNGMPHRVKPDSDNIMKAAKDSIFKEDSGVWKECCEKRWCFSGSERIELVMRYSVDANSHSE